MDTRTKILSAERARALLAEAPGEWVVVQGYFDPLLAAHARRLKALARPGKKLMAVVTSPVAPVLPAAARAELVAGLAMVDGVVAAPESQAQQFLEVLPEDLVFHEEQHDTARLLALVEQVHARQRAR